MMGQMSTAQCCCTNCEDCCNGHEPSEFDVDVSMADDDCDTCDSFVSGTYTLAKGGPCRWQYLSGAISGQYCVTPYPANDDRITSVDVTLTIQCVSPTQYRIVLTVQVSRFYFVGTEKLFVTTYNTYNGEGTDTYRYEATVDFTAFRCDEAAEYELELVSKQARRSFYYNTIFGASYVAFTAPPNATTDQSMGWDVEYYCEPANTVSLTAVP